MRSGFKSISISLNALRGDDLRSAIALYLPAILLERTTSTCRYEFGSSKRSEGSGRSFSARFFALRAMTAAIPKRDLLWKAA